MSQLPEYPRLLFSIRLTEDVKPADLACELFSEWLRQVPVSADAVRVEAGFASDSTLLMISLPASMMAYLPKNPAITLLGTTRSSNLVKARTIKHETGSQISFSNSLRNMDEAKARSKRLTNNAKSTEDTTPDLTTAVLDVLRSDNLKLKQTTVTLIEHLIDTEMEEQVGRMRRLRLSSKGEERESSKKKTSTSSYYHKDGSGQYRSKIEDQSLKGLQQQPNAPSDYNQFRDGGYSPDTKHVPSDVHDVQVARLKEYKIEEQRNTRMSMGEIGESSILEQRSSSSMTNDNNASICSLRKQDGSSCRKRCLGVGCNLLHILYPFENLCDLLVYPC